MEETEIRTVGFQFGLREKTNLKMHPSNVSFSNHLGYVLTDGHKNQEKVDNLPIMAPQQQQEEQGEGGRDEHGHGQGPAVRGTLEKLKTSPNA